MLSVKLVHVVQQRIVGQHSLKKLLNVTGCTETSGYFWPTASATLCTETCPVVSRDVLFVLLLHTSIKVRLRVVKAPRSGRLRRQSESRAQNKHLRCLSVGNKNDDPARKRVDTQDAKCFGESVGVRVFETSAKENINVEEVTSLIFDVKLV